ncbi:MAG: Rne/Rng family ribonuclease, partial [Actinomycetota bacterium]|nr:Rne/Rng family ribonuclease [Actinomycetota bacterium]
MLDNEPTGGPDAGESPAAGSPAPKKKQAAKRTRVTTDPPTAKAPKAAKAAKPAKAAKAVKAPKATKPEKVAKPTKAAKPAAKKAAGKTAKRVTPIPPAVAFIAPDAGPAVPAMGAPPSGPVADSIAPTDATAESDRPSRRRGRRGRGRGKGGDADTESTSGSGTEAAGGTTAAPADPEAPDAESAAEAEDGEATGTRRRRRRRRRTGAEGEPDGPAAEDPPNTVVKVRKTRPRGRDTDDEVQGVKGSVRLEAKRQRRREGRDQVRRRPAIITESEFLARREAVDRVMVVRQVKDRTQIAVLEDGVLVEHYVTKASANAYAGNIYLGRVQNVLPSMEAAFVDIGKSRNAVLYAGEVNWDLSGMEGKARRIEDALKAGQSVLTQVTKDPVGQKGARLTSQISLPGRFLVYVPQGSMTGISRKLPDTERKRLRDILKTIVPEDAGVIIRTAAEGASDEELTRDVKRLQAQWEAIRAKTKTATAPELLYGEPDLVIRVVRDIFNEDFNKLIVAGDDAWELVEEYVKHVSPDLVDRLARHLGETDVFADLRIDEQLAKGLERKVWLPSGGSLVIDRTEAMTVVDVNTGKFTGKGGNLEETVTRNNLEAAEEVVRQLRLRDIGGMIVIDFIDMILESNRDLVLRRLTECLGRDRTRHQVAEVTSLGLVQMTRKRVGQGLLEVFSEPCETCKGRGLIVHMEPVEHSTAAEQRHEVSEPKARKRRGTTMAPPIAVVPADGALAAPLVVEAPADGVLPEPETAAPAPRRRRRAASRPA